MNRQRIRWLWRRIVALVDDVLPMPPDHRAARDDDGRDHSARRQLQLRLKALGKRGRGGYR